MNKLVSAAIDNYLSIANDPNYISSDEFAQVGYSWKKYANAFRHRVEKYRNLAVEDILSLLVEDGSINSAYKYLNKDKISLAIEWQSNLLAKSLQEQDKHLAEYFPEICESRLLQTGSNALQVMSDGRTFSLDTFRYLAYIQRISDKLLDIRNVATYLELGSGNGGFARAIKLLNPRGKLFLVDLPEVLFCSYTFLSAEFPDCQHEYIVSSEQLSKAIESEADFVYISHHFFELIQEKQLSFDLFVNTRSIGEMTSRSLDKYRNVIQKISIKNIFLENRFLNFYNPLLTKVVGFRSNEIAGSTWMKGLWSTIDFDFDPEWCRSPFDSSHPRYLALCLKGHKEVDNSLCNYSEIEDIKLQDWFAEIKQIRPWNRSFRHLSLDTKTLACLWEINRRQPTENSLALMIDFLIYTCQDENVEEILYYKNLFRQLFGRRYVKRSSRRGLLSLTKSAVRVLSAKFS